MLSNRKLSFSIFLSSVNLSISSLSLSPLSLALTRFLSIYLSTITLFFSPLSLAIFLSPSPSLSINVSLFSVTALSLFLSHSVSLSLSRPLFLSFSISLIVLCRRSNVHLIERNTVHWLSPRTCALLVSVHTDSVFVQSTGDKCRCSDCGLRSKRIDICGRS